jgi:hypothetical protein
MIKVENHPNLAKSDSGLVINTDKTGYSKFINQRKNESKLVELETDLNILKQDIGEIKSLLNILINNSK